MIEREYNLETGQLVERPANDFGTPPIIQSVVPTLSPRQIRLALNRANLRDAVELAVATGDRDLKDWWEFSSRFERDHPRVVAMGANLGVSPTDLDALWQLGITL